MSFTKLCEKFMLLSNSGRKKMIPPARSGMHDKSSETRTILCLQCLSSPNKHSHRQHSSVAVLRRTTATRECQGQSLAQTWRNMPSCEISGTGTSPPLVSANSLRFNSSSEMRGNVDIQTLTFRASTDQTKCARWNSVVFFFFFF